MKPEVLIYSQKITNRLRYIAQLVLGDLLGIKIRITDDVQEYQKHDGARICYHNQQLAEGSELIIVPCGLLAEKGINSHQLKFIDFEGSKAFFPVYSRLSPLPFDLFAAAFYMVSRYEEYLPYIRDEHGRIAPASCIAYQHGFLKVAVVNRWALSLKNLLAGISPDLKFRSAVFRFEPTIDIDAAWAYRNKGLIRTIGGYFKDLRKADFSEMKMRSKVLLGLERDPFDTFGLMHEIHQKYNLKPRFFILFADYGLNDKNIPVNNDRFQILIKSLADYAHVGIHPSYASNKVPALLAREIAGLGQVVKAEITESRQHFLMLSFPETYRNLINLDITDDYTMGFAGQPGFRAGICSPFKWYDLDSETITDLTLHPFALMEGTLRDYLKLEAGEAMATIEPLVDEVRAVGGTFISLWHNESFSEQKRWVGWVGVYRAMLDYALRS